LQKKKKYPTFTYPPKTNWEKQLVLNVGTASACIIDAGEAEDLI
jgi:hypothetical protein